MKIGPYQFTLRSLIELFIALALWQGAIKLSLVTWDLWWLGYYGEEGTLALEAGDRKGALAAYQAVWEMNADDAAGAEGLAWVRLGSDDRAGARALYESLGASLPAQHVAAADAGRAVLELLEATETPAPDLIRLDKAHTLLTSALHHHAALADAQALIGQVAFLQGKPDAARASFLRAVEQGASASSTGLALAYNGLGLTAPDAEQGYRAFQTATQYRTRWIDPYLNRDRALAAWILDLLRRQDTRALALVYEQARLLLDAENATALSARVRRGSDAALDKEVVERARVPLYLAMALVSRSDERWLNRADGFLRSAQLADKTSLDVILAELQIPMADFRRSGYQDRGAKKSAREAGEKLLRSLDFAALRQSPNEKTLASIVSALDQIWHVTMRIEFGEPQSALERKSLRGVIEAFDQALAAMEMMVPKPDSTARLREIADFRRQRLDELNAIYEGGDLQAISAALEQRWRQSARSLQVINQRFAEEAPRAGRDRRLSLGELRLLASWHAGPMLRACEDPRVAAYLTANVRETFAEALAALAVALERLSVASDRAKIVAELRAKLDQ